MTSSFSDEYKLGSSQFIKPSRNRAMSVASGSSALKKAFPLKAMKLLGIDEVSILRDKAFRTLGCTEQDVAQSVELERLFHWHYRRQAEAYLIQQVGTDKADDAFADDALALHRRLMGLRSRTGSPLGHDSQPADFNLHSTQRSGILSNSSELLDNSVSANDIEFDGASLPADTSTFGSNLFASQRRHTVSGGDSIDSLFGPKLHHVEPQATVLVPRSAQDQANLRGLSSKTRAAIERRLSQAAVAVDPQDLSKSESISSSTSSQSVENPFQFSSSSTSSQPIPIVGARASTATHRTASSLPDFNSPFSLDELNRRRLQNTPASPALLTVPETQSDSGNRKQRPLSADLDSIRKHQGVVVAEDASRSRSQPRVESVSYKALRLLGTSTVDVRMAKALKVLGTDMDELEDQRARALAALGHQNVAQ